MDRHALAALLVAVSVSAAAAAAADTGAYRPCNGDLVFHESRSPQSEAIRIATGSRYTHVGIVYLDDGVAWVFEAVEPVRSTPLDRWIARGVDGHFVAKRLVDARSILTAEVLQRMLAEGRAFTGSHYDLRFEWSDDRLYCSELVWKIFKRAADVELGALQRLGDLDTSDPVVRARAAARFGSVLPVNEPVITPVAVFDSDLLETVFVAPPPAAVAQRGEAAGRASCP